MNTKTNANHAFTNRFEEVQGLIYELQEKIAELSAAQEKTPESWGHVGYMGHIAESLKDLLGKNG